MTFSLCFPIEWSQYRIPHFVSSEATGHKEKRFDIMVLMKERICVLA